MGWADESDDHTSGRSTLRKRLLITGASGFVGTIVVPRFRSAYTLRLLDRTHPGARRDDDEFVCADIGNPDQMRAACIDVDTVVHLAGTASIHATFDDLLSPNIVGTYNVFDAAHRAGCKRIIFASSIHTVHGAVQDTSITPTQAVNPSNMYGVTKCFGEALARHYANQGLSALCVRIGAIREPDDLRSRDPDDMWRHTWISPYDLAEILVQCVEASAIDFGIVHALSHHRHSRLSISDNPKQLEYVPRDSSTPTDY